LGTCAQTVLRVGGYRGQCAAGQDGATAISPIALEAVKRIDALFDVERGINGRSAEERLRVRLEQSAALMFELGAWLREQRSRLSRSLSVTESPITCFAAGIGLPDSSMIAALA
jgi:hypothetical protein